ncbi:MAG: HD domain-containing protein [Bacteroidota bacterium]
MDYEGVKSFIIDKLSRELDPRLFYHDLNHTIDVLQSVERLASLEKISPEETLLIKTASLFHDSGMLKTYVGHEEASCEIANEILPGYGYSPRSIESINRMILTTKLPQSAKDKLEQIICDADLDYLGREDFYMISHRLKLEWNLFNIKPTTLKEWYGLQIEFLKKHNYFTISAIETREDGKLKNLQEIMEIMNGAGF